MIPPTTRSTPDQANSPHEAFAGAMVLGTLAADLRDALAARARVQQYDAGEPVMEEGAPVDRVGVVLEGTADVGAEGAAGPVRLGVIEAGGTVGAEAVLDTPEPATMTVTARTPLRVAVVDRGAVEAVVGTTAARDALAREAEHLVEAWFFKRNRTFRELTIPALFRLAQQAERNTVDPGTVIIREGVPGEACYLVRRGEVEVTLHEDGEGERTLATLGPGSIVGEISLLMDVPRTASVHATERCELLVLRREQLLDVVRRDVHSGTNLLELVQLRSRPRRKPGVEVHRRRDEGGETVITLHDPERNTFFRLSPEGWFVWQRLDGRHTLRDLSLEYMSAHGSFGAGAIADIIRSLVDAGMAETGRLREDVASAMDRHTRVQRALRRLRGLLEFSVELHGVDAFLSRTWPLVRWLYTRPAQLLLALLSVAGLAAFAVLSGTAAPVLTGDGGLWLLAVLVPAEVVSTLVHEAAHAYTTKAFGRRVPRAGVGWYWLGLVAFVDTSEMWLADRRQRLAVTLAGPYVNLILAGLASLAGLLLPHPVAAAALWQLALVSYVTVLVNFNPLLELDGYYVLMDWLDRPNLRARAMRWLGRELPRLLRAPRSVRSAELRAHRLELAYGIGSILYIAASVTAGVVLYRGVVEAWMRTVLPASLAEALVWVVAAAVAALALAGVLADLAGIKADDRGR